MQGGRTWSTGFPQERTHDASALLLLSCRVGRGREKFEEGGNGYRFNHQLDWWMAAVTTGGEPVQ